MQNHRIQCSTATWGIVEDASEPAPFLSVVANRNGKWTRTFALFERQSLQKTHNNQKVLKNRDDHLTRGGNNLRKTSSYLSYLVFVPYLVPNFCYLSYLVYPVSYLV